MALTGAGPEYGKKPRAGDGQQVQAEAADEPYDQASPVSGSQSRMPENESSPGAGSSTDPFAGYSTYGRPFDNPPPRHLKKELLTAKTYNKSLAQTAGWVQVYDPDGEKRATRVLQQGVRNKTLSTRVQWDWQEVDGVWHEIMVKHNRLTGGFAIDVSTGSTYPAPRLQLV
jgi:hypothetical protein